MGGVIADGRGDFLVSDEHSLELTLLLFDRIVLIFFTVSWLHI